jgi:hypothetical protein
MPASKRIIRRGDEEFEEEGRGMPAFVPLIAGGRLSLRLQSARVPIDGRDAGPRSRCSIATGR